MYADMHIHSTASDGLQTPEEIVALALKKGLCAISITDHDTTEGIKPALEAAKGLPLEVIPGIEINTDYMGHEIHILGYYFDIDNKALQETLCKIRDARVNRAKEMVRKLQKMGIEIPLKRVYDLAQDGTVGRPHVARVMVEQGYVSSIKEAFEKYIGINSPAYAERYKLLPHEAVRLLRRAEGIPVLAHPGIHRKDNLLHELIGEGLKGVEVYHSDHDPSTTEHYRKLAEKLKLLVTGGSDCHGQDYREGAAIGGTVIPYEAVQKIKQLKDSLDRLGSWEGT